MFPKTRPQERPTLPADEEAELPQLALELLGVGLAEMDAAFGEQVDVEGCLAELVIGQTFQPLFYLRL